MFAIVTIGGHQFKIEPDKYIYVNRLNNEAGDEIEAGSEINLDKVLLVVQDGQVQVGKPYVENAVVKARVDSHLQGDKVIVFKKKRRKGYRRKKGHRQALTKLQIEQIQL